MFVTITVVLESAEFVFESLISTFRKVNRQSNRLIKVDAVGIVDSLELLIVTSSDPGPLKPRGCHRKKPPSRGN